MSDPITERNDALKMAMDERQAWADLQNAGPKSFHRQGCEWREHTGGGYWTCEEGCRADEKYRKALDDCALRLAMADSAVQAREWKVFRAMMERYNAENGR